ncbi:MAG: hypothetical protein WC444_04840 [Candidatus Paceibacterota bacterium]
MFIKTGDAMEVQKVLCECGGEIDESTKKCKKCGKDYNEKKADLVKHSDEHGYPASCGCTTSWGGA